MDSREQLDKALEGRYRIEREIGRGGAAVVYLARDCKHDRQVALKVLRPDLSYSVGADRFLREIRIAAQLSHPHILPVHDSGEADGFLYYVMPFVEGESLSERLERVGRMETPEVVRLLHDVLDALQYAHGRGVIHRDIKPGNVMVAGRHALVADFGVAKAVRSARQPGEVDSLGVVLGTPTYIAPEQASADPSLDHRADLYAIGVVAYEMLCGKPPFRGGSAQQVLAAHVTEQPTPIVELRPDLPAGLAEWLMLCLEKDPADRWQSAGEMLEYLERYASLSEDSGDVTEPALPIVRRRKRRMRMTLASLVVAVAVVATGVVFRGAPEAAASGRPVLVVLPFANLGATEDDYFASGITDAITARLASLGGLGVISRTSAMHYADSDQTTRQIGAELGVDYILEGTIQRERPGDATSRVRIIPQLIRVTDDTHLWADVFDEDLTEVFRVQSEIAERVARALDVAILVPERRSLAARYTTSVEAYELYLRGHDYLAQSLGGGDANARRNAIDLFERAIVLDGSFALAWAELSLAHIWLYRYFIDPSPSRLAMARVAMDTALALDASLPAVHMARGHVYYWGDMPAPAEALEEFEHVIDREPNNAYAHTMIASLLAARGEWDRALENAKLATDLDPLEPEWAVSAARMYLTARRYDEAGRLLDRALTLAPDHSGAHRDRLALGLRRDGDLEAARLAVADMAVQLTPGQVAMALAEVAPELVVTGAYDSLFDGLLPGSISGPLPLDYYWVRAEFYRLRGEDARARVYYDSLRVSAETVLGDRTDDPRSAMVSAWALIGAGRTEAALARAADVERLMETVTDESLRRAVHETLFRVYGGSGDLESALDHLEALLNMPSLVSVPYLRIAVLPDGIRAHPRFVALLRSGAQTAPIS